MLARALQFLVALLQSDLLLLQRLVLLLQRVRTVGAAGEQPASTIARARPAVATPRIQSSPEKLAFVATSPTTGTEHATGTEPRRLNAQFDEGRNRSDQAQPRQGQFDRPCSHKFSLPGSSPLALGHRLAVCEARMPLPRAAG